MEKHELDAKIIEVSKSIFSYCMARVSNQQDAEDLAQDIICEIMKSSQNIRDDKAFYGFMWSVAGNVYKQWYRKKLRIFECELNDDIHDETEDMSHIIDEMSDIYLLRRELALLSERYRCATTLYYLDNKSCAEIASLLSVSESMVKYLLFKSRKILKDGVNMERNIGELSYNPKTLEIMYMGEGPNHYFNLVEGSIIRQNILWACYNDHLKEDEIALSIGVSLPYIEDDLKKLTEIGLLVREGYYYRTNIIILTEDFVKEKAIRLLPIQNEIAGKIMEFIGKNQAVVRNIGFYGCNMSQNSLKWQLTCMILHHAYGIASNGYFTPGKAPITAFGEHAYVWGQERVAGGFNCCSITAAAWRTNISMYFMDWIAKPNTSHNDFYGNVRFVKLYDKLTHDHVKELDNYEWEMIAELIRKGYVCKKDDQIRVTMPVFTSEEYEKIFDLMKPVIDDIGALFVETHSMIASVLRNHAPSHLKSQVEAIAGMSLFNDGAYVPASIMNKNGYLSTDWNADEIATAYVVLN